MNDDNILMAIEMLRNAKIPLDVIYAWDIMGDLRKGNILIVGLENDDKESVYPKGLKEILEGDNGFVTYFNTEKLFFLDDELLSEMEQYEHRNVTFPIDYSIMLDTNFASYIQKFVKGKWSSLNNDILRSIDSLLRYDFRYDYNYYLIENYYNVYLKNYEG